MGNFGFCLHHLLLLAFLPVLSRGIYPVYRDRDRDGDSTRCQLVISARASQDRWSYFGLSPAAHLANRLPLAAVSIDLRAKFNAGKGSARLFPKPACGTGY